MAAAGREAALLRPARPAQPLAAAVLGTTSIGVGLLWDISWHATIGRDTFWTPAHLAIYLGGILCGLSAAWVALSTTFGGSGEQRAVAVRFWGFRAPLGAWVAIWGTLAMLTSAPFDDWWHNAYGLDVTILSPPHVLLVAGILCCQLGAMLQALSVQNRAAGAGDATPWERRLPPLVFAYCAGLLLVVLTTLLLEYSEPNRQHGALFYEISCAAYPLVLVGVARGARLRWPATTVTAVYMAVRLAMTWVLPLFPASPMLAPIYNPVHHMWPLFFPELPIVPAVAIDLLLRRAADSDRHRGQLPRAIVSGPTDWRRVASLSFFLGVAFTALLLAAHWYFADFMLTRSARNWLFAADQWPYDTRLGDWRYRFWLEGDAFGRATIPLLVLLAAISARLGLAWGGWLSRVRR
jgi:hypothetical protein